MKTIELVVLSANGFTHNFMVLYVVKEVDTVQEYYLR